MSSEGTQHSEGDNLLTRISTEMVRAQKRFFGKGPTQAKSYFLDDMLIIVMKGGLTTAEKTMLDFGQEDQVREFRQVFENEMSDRLTSMIEQLTGRHVVSYQSQIMFSPDRVVEMFVFDDQARAEFIKATAQGQLHGEPVGEVASDDVGLDEPSSSGQA
ncbi:MAG: DUF2294 domain-containing protein [Chloroflexota bacterium]|nr:DUF2294 domain-containing protein [Chloroflexota bacterium]